MRIIGYQLIPAAARLCASTSLVRRHYSMLKWPVRQSDEPEAEPFSKSAAYFGRDKETPRLYYFDYYDSNTYRVKRFFSIMLSIAAIGVYVLFFREPNDFDELMNAPPYLVSTRVERRYLREKIAQFKTSGRDTSLLEAELDYVDVKEDAMRREYEKEQKKAAMMAERSKT